MKRNQNFLQPALEPEVRLLGEIDNAIKVLQLSSVDPALKGEATAAAVTRVANVIDEVRTKEGSWLPKEFVNLAAQCVHGGSLKVFRSLRKNTASITADAFGRHVANGGSEFDREHFFGPQSD